eukprot:jgi/Psemu1/18011/gm1.18011_g
MSVIESPKKTTQFASSISINIGNGNGNNDTNSAMSSPSSTGGTVMRSPSSTGAVRGAKSSGKSKVKGLVKSGWLSGRKSKSKSNKSGSKKRSNSNSNNSNSNSNNSSSTSRVGGGGDDAASILSAQSTVAASVVIDNNDDATSKTSKTYLNDGASATSSSNTLPALADEKGAVVAGGSCILEGNEAEHETAEAAAAASSTAAAAVLDLVVLLMDPASHRFELLQLEFEDANRAKVSDVLVQIPISVTEPSLKKLVYDGVLDENYYRATTEVLGGGTTVRPSSRLLEAFGSNYCSNSNNNNNNSYYYTSDHTTSAPVVTTTSVGSKKMVLVAKPVGVSNAECLRLAKPILTNRDVSKMLELSGFNVSGWKSKKFPSRAAEKVDKANKKKATTAGATTSATATAGPKKLGEQHQQLAAAIASATPPPKTKKAAAAAAAPPIPNSPGSYLALGLVFALVATMLFQSVVVKPLSPGAVLTPGTYKTKCGLFGYISLFAPAGWKEAVATGYGSLFSSSYYYGDETLSSLSPPGFLSCRDEFLRVGYDGTVTLYDSDRKPSMILRGNVCGEENDTTTTTTASSCRDGLWMDPTDNTLSMGGKAVRQAWVRKSDRDKKLSPWPFAEEPARLKYKVGSSKVFPATFQ